MSIYPFLEFLGDITRTLPSAPRPMLVLVRPVKEQPKPPLSIVGKKQVEMFRYSISLHSFEHVPVTLDECRTFLASIGPDTVAAVYAT